MRHTRGTERAFDPTAGFPAFTGNKKPSREEPILKKASATYYWEALYKIGMQNQFCQETSTYAAQSKHRQWVDLNRAEYKHFLTCLMWFGINKIPEISMVWNPDSSFHNSFISGLMRYTRFRQILSCWHWESHYLLTTVERIIRNKADGFWSINSLVKMFAENFRECYTNCQCRCIDEMGIPWTGRHRCKCYNPNKPHKWHFKVYALNDSETGYIIDCFMYKGKDEERPPDVSATAYPIMKLMNRQTDYDCGVILFFDNWYTTWDIAQWLVSKGIHFVSTVRVGRVDPKSLYMGKGERFKRGEFKYSSRADVSLVSWMDSKAVHCLTDLKTELMVVQRNSKEKIQDHISRLMSQCRVFKKFILSLWGELI